MITLKKCYGIIVYLNTGLTINYNNKKFFSEKGLYDLLDQNIDSELLYPIIHFNW